MGLIIDDLLIKETGGILKTYHKNDIIIEEGKISEKFFYLSDGELMVFNFTEEGKEFLQHKVIPGQFFGEPAVLLGRDFPGNVKVVSEKASVYIFPKNSFEKFLMDHPDRLLDFTKSIAEKSIRKSTTLKNIVFQCPEERILNQLKEYKKEKGKEDEKIIIGLTRKEISNMTGLRIETIIRTVKKMENAGKLEIKSGKIFF